MENNKCSPHGWTLDTLNKHLGDQIASLKETVREQDERNRERFATAKDAVISALAAADKALSKAESASEKRFEGVNEFRGTLSDQASRLLPRAEYTVAHEAIEDKLTNVDRRVLAIETGGQVKSETHATSVSTIVAIISVIYGIIASSGIIITLLLRH